MILFHAIWKISQWISILKDILEHPESIKFQVQHMKNSIINSPQHCRNNIMRISITSVVGRSASPVQLFPREGKNAGNTQSPVAAACKTPISWRAVLTRGPWFPFGLSALMKPREKEGASVSDYKPVGTSQRKHARNSRGRDGRGAGRLGIGRKMQRWRVIGIRLWWRSLKPPL